MFPHRPTATVRAAGSTRKMIASGHSTAIRQSSGRDSPSSGPWAASRRSSSAAARVTASRRADAIHTAASSLSASGSQTTV